MKALISLIQPAFDWTWQNSLQVALLVGLVVLVQTVLARWLTPRLRYALSLLILLRLLLPAVPSSPLSLENLFRPAARLEAQSLAPERRRLGEASLPEAALPDAPLTPIVAEPAPVAPATSLPVVTPFVSAPPSRLPALSVAEVLGLAWACGLLALVSLAGWRYAEWCRLIRQGRRLSDPRLLTLLDEAREAMGVRRPVTLVAMAQLISPAVFGFRRVRLLLPETMLDQLTDQELRLLFLHEMAHVRRHDMLLNLLLMAVQFVHWFNPLLWLGLHRLRADRELVCDAMVLQRTSPEERSGYGLLLLKLLTDFPADQAIIPTAVPVVSSQRELKRRIVLIKHHRSASRGVCVATVMAAVALACLTFTGSSQSEPSHDTPNASEHPTLVQGRQVAEWVQAVTIGSLIPSPACAVLDNAWAQVMPQLTRLLLEDPSSEMRAKAAIAIGYIAWHKHSAPEVHDAIPALTTAAQDTNADVRLYSVQALAAIGRAAGSAIPVLINLTSDPDDGVRMSAVEALGRVHAATAEPAVAALKMALLDRNSGVRTAATVALEIVQSGHIRSFTSPPGQFSPNPARAANGSAANGLSSSGWPPEQQPLETRFFRASTNELIQGLHVGLAPMDTNGAASIVRALLDYFKQAGVDLDQVPNPGKKMFYDDPRGILIVRATPIELDIVEHQLHAALRIAAGTVSAPRAVPESLSNPAMTNNSASNGLSGSALPGGKRKLYTRTFNVDTNTLLKGMEAALGPKATSSPEAINRALLNYLGRCGADLSGLSRHIYNDSGVVVVLGTRDTVNSLHRALTALGVLKEDVPELFIPDENEASPAGSTSKAPASPDSKVGQTAKVSWLIHDGKLLYELGKLDEAEAKLNLVLKEDSTNKTAHYYLDLVAREKRRRAGESEVEGTWSDPTKRELLPGADHFAQTNPAYTGQGRQALLAKLDRIRLDRVSFYWQPLGEVVRFLNDETKKRDPEKRGINYLINQNIDSAGPTVTPLPKQAPDGQPTPVAPAEQVNLIAIPIKIYPALTDIRLADVLDAIVKGAEQPIKYSIEDYAIVFSERGTEKIPLYVRTFKVDTNVFLSGLRNSEPPEGIGVGRGIEVSPRIPSPSPSDGERVPSTTLTPDLPRFGISGRHLAEGTAVSALVLNHLARLGVDFDPKRNPGKAVFYKDRQGVLLVRATLQDLDIVERMIVELNAASPGGQSGIPQSTNLVVRIDAKGNLAIRQTRVTFPELGSYLTAELAKHPELRMDIQADKSVPMEAIIKVMDAMKRARPETGSPGLSVGETGQGKSVADWVKEAEISIRPGKEGEHALGVLQNAGPQIMPQLSLLLREDESPEIQAKAAWIMSVIGYRNPDAPEVHAAFPVLTTAAQNKNTEVRIYSVQALGAIGRASSNAAPVLIRLARDENSSVRMSAVEALGRIGASSPESVAALTAAVSDASSDVRITARKALIMAQGGKASSLMTSNEAGALAEHLANEKAQALYNCQPFRNGPSARFVRDHWTWHHLQAQGLGDIEATVEFAADGAEPKVAVVRLESVPRTP